MSDARAKSGRTYYDDERLAVMRENLENHDWAQNYLQGLLKGAGQPDTWTFSIHGNRLSVDRWSQFDEQFFWNLMPTTTVTMMYDLDKYGVSPEHGTAVRKGRSFYHPWNYDPINHPYQIQDPIDGTWYPSNDFAEGDMTSGPYPDDGSGMMYEGEKYFPVREAAIATYLGFVTPLMERMSQAYLLTGNEEYAHKCAILMAKVAHEYPNPTDKADRCQKKPWGRHSGLVTDHIWETFKLTSMAKAYDALYEHIGQDEQLVSFLQEKGVDVQTPEDVQDYIEEHILRIGMKALQEGVIRGNQGFHQLTAMTLALVMDDYSDTSPNSKEIVDWAMFGGGQMAWILSNHLFRDGGGVESPSYNSIKFDFIDAAKTFEQIRKHHSDMYPDETYPDIFANPKARAMFEHFIDLRVLNTFTPSIGDTGGGLLTPKRYTSTRYAYETDPYAFAYAKYEDPRYARAFLNDATEIKSWNPLEEYFGDEMLQAAQKPESEIVKRTRAMDGYGVGVMRSGEGENARAMYLNYSNHWAHDQYDDLSIGLYHDGVCYLPDLGYPFTWEYRNVWDGNLYMHNTVTVDETFGTHTCPMGRANLLAEHGPLHVISAAHDPYIHHEEHNPDVPDLDLYERTSVMVDVSEEEYYLLDLFVVSGGTQHDQSWHGPICPVQKPDLDWTDQETGTLAGPDVEQFGEWTDSRGRERTGPFSFLKDVSRATATEPCTFTWDMGLDFGAKMRLSIVPVDRPVNLVTSSGRSPARPPDWSIDYLFVRREGEKNEPTRFLSVIDTRSGDEPTVKEIQVLIPNPLTVRVEHSRGVDVLTLHVPLETAGTFAPRNIGVSLRRDEQVWRIGGSEDRYARGTVEKCDYPANTIVVEGIDSNDLEGPHVRVFTDHRSSLYRVLEAESVEGDAVRLHLDQTNIIFEGIAEGFSDGRITNGAALYSWTSRLDEDGTLIPYRLWHRDVALASEDGKTVRKLMAAPAGREILLDEPVSGAVLEGEYTDANGDGRAVIRGYDYGAGSHVEFPLVSTDAAE